MPTKPSATHGNEEGEVHAGSHWRRLRRADRQRHQVRLLRRTHTTCFSKDSFHSPTLIDDRYTFHEIPERLSGNDRVKLSAWTESPRAGRRIDASRKKIRFALLEAKRESTRNTAGNGPRTNEFHIIALMPARFLRMELALQRNCTIASRVYLTGPTSLQSYQTCTRIAHGQTTYPPALSEFSFR